MNPSTLRRVFVHRMRWQACFLATMIGLLTLFFASRVEAGGQEEKGKAEVIRLDPLGKPVRNADFLRSFQSQAIDLLDKSAGLSASDLANAVKSAPNRSNVSLTLLKELYGKAETSEEGWYERQLKSLVVVGTIFDCGKCNRLHPGVACGVIVSSDGLVLTNQHVVARNDPSIKGHFVMTYDGKVCPIVEILSANAYADISLIRIKSDEPLHPARIAERSPQPGSRVRLLSHPHDEFFVLTEGVVSRYSSFRIQSAEVDWMEITAEFGAGSSGAGVFNEDCELVGLVSRVFPLMRQEGPGRPLPEVILRQCVPHSAIIDCFTN